MSTELDLDGVIAMLVSMFDRAHADSAGRVIGVSNEQRARRIQKEAQDFLLSQQTGVGTMSRVYDSQAGEYVSRNEMTRRSKARARLAARRKKDAITEGTRRAAGTVQGVLSGFQRSVESEQLHAPGSGLVDVISAFTGDRDAQERVASAASAEQSKAKKVGGTPWLAETVKEAGSERDKLASSIQAAFEPMVAKAAGVPTSFDDLDAQQQARQSVASIEMLVSDFGVLVDNILATSDGDPLPAIQALLDEMQQRAGSVVKSTWQRRRLRAMTRETLHEKGLPV